MTRQTPISYSDTKQSHQSFEGSAAADIASRLRTISGRIIAPGLGINIQLKGTDDDEHGDNTTSTLTKELRYIVISTGLLIPGDGPPLVNGVLVIDGKLIEWVGPQGVLPSKYVDKALKSYSVPYLMPGLWDCHTHFVIPSPEDAYQPAYMPFISSDQPSVGARLARACWESLQNGCTSVRDVGGYGCEISKAIQDGSIVGPNVYSSGACLSQLAGHGDVFSWPVGDVLLNLGVGNVRPGHFGNQVSCIVDGVDECRRAVRMQIRRGAKCIKILASGGIMSSDDNPMYAQFSEEELAVIIDEAKCMERPVAAHVHGKPGIMAAVKAGVTTVEHVSYADDECISLIKEKDVVYVATAAVIQMLFDTGGEGIPKKIWEKLKVVAPRAFESYKEAVKAGVIVALGTDLQPGNNMAFEMEYAVKAGLTNLEAIRAATANGPLTVRGQVPKTGQLKIGYEADVLGLTASPIDDVKVLQNKDIIKWVWKGGKIFKGPGVGPWGEEEC